jgi:hypothetical protein
VNFCADRLRACPAFADRDSALGGVSGFLAGP